MMTITKFLFRQVLRRAVPMVVMAVFSMMVMSALATGKLDAFTSVDGGLQSIKSGVCFVDKALGHAPEGFRLDLDDAPVVGRRLNCSDGYEAVVDDSVSSDDLGSFNGSSVSASHKSEMRAAEVDRVIDGDAKMRVAEVDRVIDGDTVVIKTEGGDTVSLRLRNIDAPEKAQGHVGNKSGRKLMGLMVRDCEGKDAYRVLVRKTAGPKVRFRVIERDKHGRPVVDIWSGYGDYANDGAPPITASLNYLMVVEGWAYAWRYGGGYGYEELRAAETHALQAGLGVHDRVKYADLARPEDWKAAKAR